MVRIAIMGVSGRMGQMLLRLVDESDLAVLSAAVERQGHDWIGQDLGSVQGGAARGIIVTDDLAQALECSDAIVDFTAPAVSVPLAEQAAAAGVAHVIGTTGFDDDDLAAIAQAGKTGRIVRAGNMSLGVNLLVKLTQQIAQALDTEYDIEIIEAHHRHKVDAPSGTALMLGEAAARGRGVLLPEVADRGRDGITGPRDAGAIGFHAIRGGDYIGEHDVVFAGPGERIVLRHVASDRALFARGAIRAAIWLQTQDVGEYSMFDVLGL
ncbi:4-hydroxy-tetrahydrodipicolinate reductase [Roseinatronobacter alkalisoli]|uniref:4-hydroxy-tetrahydrodipicolinate reductase n=1 Tax=Roseinatronobacter alkalisoli TaxID=3028235 RepID=A0ABT5T5R2_9RHOB|nr:4-hydroxy-tetrahydrodipicolinate reductase [Roseinatronobacter sp. HJB301]MDD7970070.1 4-hydroxy-tetrahydrodipicolinate reductase [Roseinatronobacter sp. HJB301]